MANSPEFGTDGECSFNCISNSLIEKTSLSKLAAISNAMLQQEGSSHWRPVETDATPQTDDLQAEEHPLHVDSGTGEFKSPKLELCYRLMLFHTMHDKHAVCLQGSLSERGDGLEKIRTK